MYAMDEKAARKRFLTRVVLCVAVMFAFLDAVFMRCDGRNETHDE